MAAGERGAAAERWVKNFAAENHILDTAPPQLETIIKLANNYLQRRFIPARTFVEKEISYANEWIGTILSGKQLPKPAPSEVPAHRASRKQLAAKLLDYALATDCIVTLKTNTGKDCTIAIDVTADPQKEAAKLNTIQGRKENEEKEEFNRNKNLPAVRRQLGIDKHLVLVINDRNPPSPNVLLDKLYWFANQPGATASINLHQPEPELDPPTPSVQQLWQLYSQQIPKTNTLDGVKAFAQKALESGAPPEIVPEIIKCSSFIQDLATKLPAKQTQALVNKLALEAAADLEETQASGVDEEYEQDSEHER